MEIEQARAVLVPMNSASPWRVMASTVGAPLRSNSALVATVVRA